MIVHPTGKFDNHAKAYGHITARPLAAAMGAEIRGVRIAEVTDAQFVEIQDALFRHKMIYFRDQAISHAPASTGTLRIPSETNAADPEDTTRVMGTMGHRPFVRACSIRSRSAGV